MALPLALRLYLLAQGAPGDTSGLAKLPSRPAGRLVWLDAPDVAAAVRLGKLAEVLVEQGLADAAILTCPEPVDGGRWVTLPPPAERPQSIERFLDHFSPDLGLIAGSVLRPILTQLAQDRNIPLMLVEGHGSPSLHGGGWWPGLLARALSGLSHCLVMDDTAARAFRKAGAPVGIIQVAGPLEEPSHHLPANEAERAALARVLGTRPVWLAVGVPETEDDAVAAAHLLALRMAHRLLLILVPDDPARAAALAVRLASEYGLDISCRSAEDDPRDEIQVYLVDTTGELGLWLRLATTTYLGGTLSGGALGAHPFVAAAQGSALIHGLRTETASRAFERLRQAGASRVLPSATDLGEAVGDLLAADRAARLAQAAWAVATAGRETTLLVCDLVRAILPPETRPAA